MSGNKDEKMSGNKDEKSTGNAVFFYL